MVGRDALNVLTPVRFRLSLLDTEATRLAEETVLKTAGRKACEFESHRFRFGPVDQRQDHLFYTQAFVGSSPTGITCGSIGKLADHLGLNPEMLWVRIPLDLLMPT